MQVRLINLLLHIKIFIQITAIVLTSKIMEIVKAVVDLYWPSNLDLS